MFDSTSHRITIEPLRGAENFPVWKIKISDILTDLNYDDHIENKAAAVRATRHKTPGESSDNITVNGYGTTHLQENPQRLG